MTQKFNHVALEITRNGHKDWVPHEKLTLVPVSIFFFAALDVPKT
jgi:hypothetical protein